MTPSRRPAARELIKPIVLIAVVLAIPIVPFLGFGESLEGRIEGWLDATLPPAAIAGVVVGVLATDVFLPVPSSVVSTFAGEALGFWAATAVSWLGLTIGAVLGFGLARLFGRPLARWLSGDEELGRMDELSGRFGPLILVLTRPVPVLAEASVLFLGATRLPWARFLPPVILSNLGIAAAYSALGDLVSLWVAVPASIALPLLAATIAHWLWSPARGVARSE